MTPPQRDKSRGRKKPGPHGLSNTEVEERRFPRKVLDEARWLDCEGVGCELQGKIRVLGSGGVFIRTRQTFPVGTALGLRIRKGDDWLETVGVVRSQAQNGIGVEFMPPRTRLLAQLHDLLGNAKS